MSSVVISVNSSDFHGHLADVQLVRLPAGKSVNINVVQASGGPATWDLVVKGRTESGEEFSESLFLDLNG